jgi:hypothetical protein
MFSPDNFVQLPEFTQSFNRYSYCLNNPLKYVDPSGQRWGRLFDEWDLDICTGIMNKVGNLGGDERHYVNLIDNGNSLGQYVFPGQNFSMNWNQDIYGNITLGMEGFTSDFSSRASFLQQFYANETGYFVDGMRMSSVSYTAGVVGYDFYRAPASGRIAYSPFNVGDLIGVGMAVKALGTVAVKAISSAALKDGAGVVARHGVQAGAGGGVSESIIKGFTEHGANQAITRGFKTNDILRIVKEGNAVESMGRFGQQTRFMLGNNTVIVNSQGKVITVFSNAPGTKKGFEQGLFMLYNK